MKCRVSGIVIVLLPKCEETLGGCLRALHGRSASANCLPEWVKQTSVGEPKSAEGLQVLVSGSAVPALLRTGEDGAAPAAGSGMLDAWRKMPCLWRRAHVLLQLRNSLYRSWTWTVTVRESRITYVKGTGSCRILMSINVSLFVIWELILNRGIFTPYMTNTALTMLIQLSTHLKLKIIVPVEDLKRQTFHTTSYVNI